MPEAAPPHLYGIVNCDQVKKARHWLDQAKLAYLFHDFKKEPPSAALVNQWLAEIPWDELVNQRSTTWRALPADVRPTDAKSALQAILANSSLIKRPVLVVGQHLMVGFDPERYQSMIGSSVSETLLLAKALIARASVTPDDAGCQALLTARLTALGFTCETLLFGDVTNLWATRTGTSKTPLLAFAGHTDVVPTGPLSSWTSPPFEPTIRDGRLYGRGASDMKTSIAAFVVAVEEFVATTPDHTGTIGLLITSDEEGPSTDGTARVVEAFRQRGLALDYCIVGEPTSVDVLGDMMKNGRRGTLSARLEVQGVQGHVAYPHLARNPVHEAAAAIARLTATEWDQGNAFYLPTTLQISNIHAGTGAGNVIPGHMTVDFNLRFSTASTVEGLKSRIHAIFDQAKLDYTLAWTVGGQPFLTTPGELSEALTKAILAETGVAAALSTTGGTSDGRFIATICPQVVEFGPPNASIHKIDENVEVRFLDPLKNIYRQTLHSLLGTRA